mgnify:CR=1 FL=1
MKKTIRTLAIFSLIMSGIYFGKWFIQTDYFKIREIPVSGDNALLKRSIVSKLEKLKGENIVYIDTKKIEKMVKEDVRVKNATIQKVFPSKLKINIEERKIHAYVKRGNDLYLADSDLNLFGYVQEKNKAPNLPIIIYTDDESMKDLKIIISKIKNKRMISDYNRLGLNKSSNIYHYITRDAGKLVIQECAYPLIELDNIKDIKDIGTSVSWSDGIKKYKFTYGDSQI